MDTEHLSESLFLRALEPDDIDFLYDLENREDSFLVGENCIPFSRDFLQRFVYASLHENLLSTGQLRLVACKTPPLGKKGFEMPPVGVLDFFNHDALHRRAEVGIVVCKDLRGKGLGAKILQEACVYAQNRLNLHQLHAETAVCNTSSVRIFRSCGFKRCGSRRQWIMQGGKWVDVVLWQKIFDE